MLQNASTVNQAWPTMLQRCLLPCIVPQLVRIDCHAKPWSCRQVKVEVGEAQRLRHEIVDKDLRPEVLAAPGKFAQPGKRVQVCCGTDRAFQQAAAVETNPG